MRKNLLRTKVRRKSSIVNKTCWFQGFKDEFSSVLQYLSTI